MSKIYESQVNIIIKYHLSRHFELNVYFQCVKFELSTSGTSLCEHIRNLLQYYLGLQTCSCNPITLLQTLVRLF